MKRFPTLLIPALSLAYFVNGSSNRSDIPDRVDDTVEAFGRLEIGHPVQPTSSNFLGAFVSEACVDTLKDLRARAKLDQSVDTRDSCIKALHNVNFSNVPFEAKHRELAPFLSSRQLFKLFQINPVKFQKLPWNCFKGSGGWRSVI